MNSITVHFSPFYTRCRFYDGHHFSDWHPVYSKSQNYAGIDICLLGIDKDLLTGLIISASPEKVDQLLWSN